MGEPFVKNRDGPVTSLQVHFKKGGKREAIL